MFLKCSYFLAKSEADVLINSVLIKRKACIGYWILDGVVMDVYAEYGLLWRDSWRRRYRKVLIL